MKANARGWDHTARYTELSQERSHLSGLAPNASTPLPAALDCRGIGRDTLPRALKRERIRLLKRGGLP